MQFGSRKVETGEPVLYFENISIAALQERSKLVLARGGWENQPRVTWEERSEVSFQMIEGVMSQLSFGILLDAVMMTPEQDKPLLVPMKEGPFSIQYLGQDENYHDQYGIELKHEPKRLPEKKVFIFEYKRGREQRKVYGEFKKMPDRFNRANLTRNCILIHDDDDNVITDTETENEYVVDYYYEYGNEALIYTISKERFNGLFSLEGKFYSKDENEGINYTNLLYMPKVRVVSDINLRLGERADPVVSTFNIVGLPETLGKNSTIVEIIRLGTDIDDNI